MNKKIHTALTALLLTALLTPVPVAAQAEQTPPAEEDDDEEPVIDFSEVVEAINELAEELEDFTGNWDHTLEEILISVLFRPFRTLAQQQLKILSAVLTHTPDVYPNPAVEEVHNSVLLITYLLSGLALMTAGILHITGPLLGVSYNEVRMILPRILAALIFSTVSLPLLQYAVELSNALVHAFALNQMTMTLSQLAGLSATLGLVWVVDAALLLVVVVMFIIRDVYLLFVAAISPLLALAWSIPKAKRYADSFIAGWWTALAMAPLDMLVLKFSYALLDGNGAGIGTYAANWVLGVASFTLLILVPYQLYGASQAAVGQAYIISRGLKNRARQAYNHKTSRKPGLEEDLSLNSDERNRLEAYRRKKQEQEPDNDFRSDWEDDDDE